MKLAKRHERLIVIEDCTCGELDSLEPMSCMSGDGTLLINTDEFVDFCNHDVSNEAANSLIDILKGISGAQIHIKDGISVPDSYILLRR